MPSSAPGLLTIGEFSRLSRLSVRMLRYYDANDLLAPTYVDPISGYRYYAGEQLETAGRIRTLRDIGCPVAEIGRLLPLFASPATLAEALAAQRDRLAGEAGRIDAQLREVDRLAAHLKEIAMSIEVRQIDVPAALVASLRERIPTYMDEGRLWERFMREVRATDAHFDMEAPSSTAFLDEEYKDSDVDVELRLVVTEPFTPMGDIACTQVPAHTVLSAILHGPYEGMGAVSAELGRQVAARGLRIAGPMYNVYVVGPGQSKDPAAWVTDVRLPVTAA